MNATHMALVLATVKLQVAVLAHSQEDVNEHQAIEEVKGAWKEVSALVRKLEKEEG